MMKKIILILFLVLLPISAFADELVLVKGKGVEVCEAHLKNLKSLTLNEMVCQRDESYPQANGITRPKWEEVDLRENKELVKKVEKFFYYGDQFSKVKIYDDEAAFEDYLTSVLKSNFIKISTIDIANNGKPGKVLLYSDRPCDVIENIAWNRGPYSRSLFVLDEAQKQIDVKKTEPLIDPLKKYTAIKVKTSLYILYDVFLYKDKTYFDRWDVDDWTLTVYKLSNDRGSEVCKYQYKQTKKGGK